MLSTIGVELSAAEEAALAQAKQANGPWFNAMVQAAKIQANRRAKYSGDGDPYTNFIIVAGLMKIEVAEVFRFYQAIKFARLLVAAGDFDDERTVDTLVDLANYALLEAGFRCRNSESNAPEHSSQMTFPLPNASDAP